MGSGSFYDGSLFTKTSHSFDAELLAFFFVCGIMFTKLIERSVIKNMMANQKNLAADLDDFIFGDQEQIISER